MSRSMGMIAILVCSGLAFAADPEPKPRTPSAPTPAAAERELAPAMGKFQREQSKTVQSLEGRWITSGTMTSPGKPSVQLANVVLDCRKISAGSAVSCTHGFSVPDEGRHEEAALIGVDAHTGIVHRYSVNSKGEMRDHQGVWSDDRTLMLDAPSFANGKPATSRMTITFPTPDQLNLRSVAYLPGGEQATFEVSGKREIAR